MAGVQYNFPELPIEEITQQFHMVFPDLGVNENDFKAPKADRWQHIYMTVINYLFGISADQLTQHPFGADYTHPEIYEGANYIFMLGRAMQKVMRASGVEDFSMKDVVAPSRKRLIHLMSGLINFCHFRNQRLEFYEAIAEDEKEKKTQIDILTQDNDELRRRINTIKARQAEQEPLVRTEKERCETLKRELETLQTDVVTRKKVLSDEKADLAEKTALLAQVKEKEAQLKEEISKLDGMIVQNPERMKADMDKMTKEIEQLQVRKDERAGRLVELQDQLEARRAVNEESQHALKLLNNIVDEINKHKTNKTEVTKLTEKVQDSKETLRELETQEATLKRALTSKREKLSKLTMQHEIRVKDLKESIEAMSSGDHQASRAHQKESAEVEALEAQIRALLQDNEDRRDAFNKVKKERSEKFSELEEAVELYHKKLGDTWLAAKGKMEANLLRYQDAKKAEVASAQSH